MSIKLNGADGVQPTTPYAKLSRSDCTTNMRALRIPVDLIKRRQWVLWRYEGGTKVPYRIDGRKASTTNPYDWGNYKTAIECFESQPKRFAGIGFVFHECDPVCRNRLTESRII